VNAACDAGAAARARTERLAASLPGVRLAAYVVTQPANLRYFTGLSLKTAVLLVLPDRAPRLLVREQNAVAAAPASGWCDVALLPGGAGWEAAVAADLASRMPEHVGCDDVPFSLAVKLRQAAQAARVCPRAGVASSLRRRKDPGEEAALRRAAAIADEAAAAAFAAIRPGASELAVVAEAERALRRAGADGTRFPTHFGTGPASADCDVEPSRNAIQAGAMGFFDIGPVYDGYLGDISRGFVVGTPTPDQHRIIALALEALERAAARLRPGVSAAEVCAAVHDVFDRAGLAHACRHHVGHGLGLAMDPPLIRLGSADRLEEGDFVALEPGLYIPGLGGVRFENDYYVGRDGPEQLTTCPAWCPVEGGP